MKKSTAWLSIVISFLLVQCEYSNLSTIPGAPKTKLVSELYYYVWSTDSGRFILNEATQFFYSNGFIKEKYSYCRTVLPGHTEPTFVQCTSESFEYDQMNRISSIDDVIGLTGLQENRFVYDEVNQLSVVIRYNFDWSKQKFIAYDSALIGT